MENPEQVKTEKKSFLMVVSAFIFWAVLALLLISSLNVFTIVFLDADSSKSDILSGIGNYILVSLNPFFAWIYGVALLLVYSAQKFSQLRNILSSLIIGVTALLTALAIAGTLDSCSGVDCLVLGAFLVLAQISWITAVATLPILLSKKRNVWMDKKFWLLGVFLLILMSGFFILVNSVVIAEVRERAKAIAEWETLVEEAGGIEKWQELKKQEMLQKVYADKSFPVLEPMYLPLSVVTDTESVYFFEKDKYDSQPHVYYRRYYYTEDGSTVFEILIDNATRNLDPQAAFQEDLQNPTYCWGRSAPTIPSKTTYPESLRINSNLALYNGFDGTGGVLCIYRDDGKVTLTTGGDIVLSKEELIKIAESLEKIN